MISQSSYVQLPRVLRIRVMASGGVWMDSGSEPPWA